MHNRGGRKCFTSMLYIIKSASAGPIFNKCHIHAVCPTIVRWCAYRFGTSCARGCVLLIRQGNYARWCVDTCSKNTCASSMCHWPGRFHACDHKIKDIIKHGITRNNKKQHAGLWAIGQATGAAVRVVNNIIKRGTSLIFIFHKRRVRGWRSTPA